MQIQFVGKQSDGSRQSYCQLEVLMSKDKANREIAHSNNFARSLVQRASISDLLRVKSISYPIIVLIVTSLIEFSPPLKTTKLAFVSQLPISTSISISVWQIEI
jgi:hypothetical protein